MHAIKISEDLRPLTDLKTKPAEVVGQAQETGRPVVLTRYGKGVAVLLSVESYEALQLDAAKLKLFSALHEADDAFAKGQSVDHDEVEAMVSQWEAKP